LNFHVEQLAQAAQKAMAQGHWQEAESLWQQVRRASPKHPQALASLGVHAFQRGNLKDALQLLSEARLGAPTDIMILMSTAIVLRELGDLAGENRMLTAALSIDPYFLPALLATAQLVERTQGNRLSAPHYRNALKVAPTEQHWPAALRSQLTHAKKTAATYGSELLEHLKTALGGRIDRLTQVEAERWHEVGALLSGQGKSYPSVANQLQIPRLPALPFFDRRLFPWVPEIESQTGAICMELEALISNDFASFEPYVAYEAGAPINQWQELNHSKRWSSYFLWRNGTAQVNQTRCPKTCSALEAVEMPWIGGLCPNAMFSALAPHTHIPPHHGETNARLVVHLPLIVPEKCLFRVGFEQRIWRVGETLIFDDTIEHEARNDSDQLRVVLIFDTWNPLLSASERELVVAINQELVRFQDAT